MQFRNYVALTFLVCLSITAFSQIGAKTQQGKIHGIWTNSDFGFQMTLMLNPDGSGEFDGETIKFTTQADKLLVTQQDVTNTYVYTLKDNSLTLSGGDLDKTIIFSRQGRSSATQQTTKPVAETKNNSSTAVIDKNLLGLWSGYNETIEFKPDGQCVYRGQPIPYTVSGNHITLQTGQGNFLIDYSVSGNQLSLTMNGQNYTYTKGNEKSSVGSTTAPAAGGNKIDVTLVGKWCYVNVYSSNSGGSSSSECFTLKQDGTYEYNSESSRSVAAGSTASQGSDSGTWWVEGDRIFYNSRNSGQGSYKLEKRNHPKNTSDPMIVLEGKTFVTFFNKPAW